MTVKFRMLAIAAGVLALSAAPALAQTSTPGHEMQLNGSANGQAGASGYTPGHRMQTNGSVKGHAGASGYAPGHTTTGAGVRGGANVRGNGNGIGAGANTGVNAHIK